MIGLVGWAVQEGETIESYFIRTLAVISRSFEMLRSSSMSAAAPWLSLPVVAVWAEGRG